MALIWLKRFRISTNKTVKETCLEVLKDSYIRAKKKDKSVIGKFATTYGLKSGKMIRNTQIEKKLNNVGVNALFKIRIGTFSFCNDFVRRQKISQLYRDKCACCNQNEKETAEHIILKCTYFNPEREKHLRPIITSVEDRFQNQERLTRHLIKILLGGELPASGLKPAETIVNTVNYLTAIVPKRAAKLAELERTNL